MQDPPGNQTFYRGADRILGGVCSGLAEGFHVEALWVRVAFALLAFLNGIGILIYLVLWVLMPERTGYRPMSPAAFEAMSLDVKRAWADLRAQFRSATTAPTAAASAEVTPPAATPDAPASGQAVPIAQSSPVTAHSTPRNLSFIFGAILIAIGIAFLAVNTNFATWSVIWPAALLVLGVALLVRNLERRSGK
jgi:phage shock protein C